MEYCICTSFGISDQFYSRVNQKQAGIGQGYVVLVNIYQDSSCLIIKAVEIEKKGVITVDPISKEEEQQVVVTFVDDTDFASEGKDCK